jgi:hypothetical protein
MLVRRVLNGKAQVLEQNHHQYWRTEWESEFERLAVFLESAGTGGPEFTGERIKLTKEQAKL